MPATIINKDCIEVTNRFFYAIDMLKAQKKIRGLQTFTKEHNLNRWTLNRAKFHPEKSSIKIEWIIYLVKDFGVSLDWLILGKGEMFKKKNA